MVDGLPRWFALSLMVALALTAVVACSHADRQETARVSITTVSPAADEIDCDIPDVIAYRGADFLPALEQLYQACLGLNLDHPNYAIKQMGDINHDGADEVVVDYYQCSAWDCNGLRVYRIEPSRLVDITPIPHDLLYYNGTQSPDHLEDLDGDRVVAVEMAAVADRRLLVDDLGDVPQPEPLVVDDQRTDLL